MASESSGCTHKSIIDWHKCIFCQKDTSARLVCPAESKRTDIDIGSGYKTLADNVEGFRAVGKLPPGLRVELWDEGCGLEATLREHKASWHLACRAVLHGTALERLRKRALEENEITTDEPPNEKRATRSQTGSKSTDFTALCFFCEKEGGQKEHEKLRQVLTDKLHNRVQKCATILNDTLLLAKLTSGHMSAREHKYHAACLCSFYWKASRVQADTESQTADMSVTYSETSSDLSSVNAHSLALSEVLAYMEEVRSVKSDIPAVFTLSKLCALYQEQIKRHGGNASEKIHATRLKERLLVNYPELIAVNEGRDVLMTFDDELGSTLKNIKDSRDSNAVHLMHTAKIIRDEMFSNFTEFDGKFENQCQKNAVPQSLLTLINMLLEGPGNFDMEENQAALSIAQLIVFNAVKRPRRSATSDVHQRCQAVRHPHSQETPLPIYLGMMLHTATRKAKLVNKCFKLGLSVSYQRVMQLSNKVANSVCSRYNSENVVCPPALRGGLFSVAAVDNIDHNLSSATASSSFHGTAISIIQFPTAGHSGADRSLHESLRLSSDSVSSIAVPLFYSEVPPCILPSNTPSLPHTETILTCCNDILSKEYEWLTKVANVIDENHTDEQPDLGWASFHAGFQVRTPQPKPVISMLPLFHHSANTAAMIRHSLTVVASAVKHLNTGQVPVVTYDQPLFALAKQIQWHWPDQFGEDKFVVMMGGLHIEMAALRMLGHWLDGSGWTHCLVQANVATTGVAEAFIHASHVKRTRYAHIVTAAALYACLQRSYAQYSDDLSQSDEKMSFEAWRCCQQKATIQFKYWDTVLQLELLVLTLVRSIRESDFTLYVETLQALVPWFFCLDQTHYARWLPVHLRDMQNLKFCHPNVAEQFLLGHFTVSKSNKRFSAISVDQAHEQLNALIKGDGGAIGITENESALTRWVVAGPEILRILTEFEGDANTDSTSVGPHHEENESNKKRFRTDLVNLLQVFEDVGNPFSDTSDELVTFDSNSIAPDIVSESVRKAQELGVNQYSTFVTERLHGTVSVLAPLPRNKLVLLGSKAATTKPNSKSKLGEMKSDCELFSRLYIACQSRDGNLDEFFAHENHPYPPSLSQQGNLRFGTKSDLLSCLTAQCTDSVDLSQLSVDAYFFDGAVLTQMIRPGSSRTFEDYGKKIIWPYVMSVASTVKRVDIVFDCYAENSLKTTTREKRGTGSRTRVTGAAKIPKNWQGFLRVDSNKTELFHFLSDVIISCSQTTSNKLFFVTYDSHVQSNADVDCSRVDPCSHEEADTRLILHCQHASDNGLKKLAIRTVDTDVVVLSIAFFCRLNIDELWIHFGVGKNVRLIPVHTIAASLGEDKCRALPIFHSLTGCDTTSSFSHKGKKSAWDAWNAYPTVTAAFLNLYDVCQNSDLDQATTAVLERFIILMYDRTSECRDLNSCRRQLFTRKTCALEMLPPTSNSFLQHLKRAIYQAVFVWEQSLVQQPKVVDPCLWGWMNDGNKTIPHWMTNPEVVFALSELIQCGCKKGCLSRCKCVKANLSCTALCKCEGECLSSVEADNL